MIRDVDMHRSMTLMVSRSRHFAVTLESSRRPDALTAAGGDHGIRLPIRCDAFFREEGNGMRLSKIGCFADFRLSVAAPSTKRLRAA